ncbi:MAG TPA: hypothetical protein VLW53_01075 [Candidatus Eisenbacteria bacterium]|nr:hypothetical protein [Candidatus Eisenbacteria bacterium]
MEPVLGFRIWKLKAGRLGSWAVDYCWEPGENQARCLALHGRPCEAPPGRHCQCGFWGVWSPRRCASRVCTATEPPWCVMGLIAGWGTVALHDREGFRAEYAALRCLFVDRPWTVAEPSAFRRWMSGWWGRRSGRPAEPEPLIELEDDPELREGLLEVSARYSVPLVPIEAAAHLGLLAELGVQPAQVEEAMRLGAEPRPGS